MARPRKQRPKKPVKLTIDPDLRKLADTYAADKNQSLSELVSELLKEEMDGQGRTTQAPRADRPARILHSGPAEAKGSKRSAS